MGGQTYYTPIVSLIATSLMASAAYSQEDIQLDAIVVTANKLEEDVRKVPISVQVITGEELEKQGITSVEKLMSKLPNVAMTKNYGLFSMPTVRGLATSAFNRDTPITIYIDGVPYSSSYALDLGLVDIERVEVLRGSQSSIYGRNSIGGVINIHTKDPSGELRGKVKARYGLRNSRALEGTVAGDIIENRLSASVSAGIKQDDGDVTNSLVSDNEYAAIDEKQFNARFNVKVTDSLTADLSLEHVDKDNSTAPFRARSESQFYKTQQEVSGFNKTKSSQINLNLMQNFSNFDVNLRSGYRKTNVEHKSDMDRTSNTVCGAPFVANCMQGAYFFDDTELTTAHAELKVNSTNQEGMRWVGGFYSGYDLFDAKHNGSTVPNIPGFSSDNYTDITSYQYAVFGQMTVPIAEKVELTGGLRWQMDQREIDYSDARGTKYNRDTTWQAVLPKAALSYQLDNDISFYASLSQGYRPGGYNFTSANPDAAEFKSQTSIDYELGTKASLFDNRLNIGLNLFYLDVRDIHGTNISSFNAIETVNAGQATSKGIELDATAYINDNWQIDWNLGYTNAKYTSGSFKGKRTQLTPEFTSTTALSYDAGIGLFGRLEHVYQGNMYADFSNTVEIGDHHVFNARGGYRWENGVTLEAYVDNIFDAKYAVNAYSIPIPGVADIEQVGERLTAGLSLQYEW